MGRIETISGEILGGPAGSKRGAFLLFFLAFLFGLLGSLFGLSLASSNQAVRNFLGILEPNQLIAAAPGKIERVVVEEQNAIIEAVKKVSPAVVSIVTTRDVRSVFGGTVRQQGGGTGFVITRDGLILTNKHVVSDPRAEYTVLTSEGNSLKAEVKSVDPVFDLAIVKVGANNLSVAELGDSDRLEIGQTVVAIGNALGEFQNTVTSGVLSAKERKIVASDSSGGLAEQLEGLLQTDAAINPGNSGGPLVNIKGQVIAVNTAVAGGAENISFAIPINSAKSAIESFKRISRIARPMIGVRYILITKEVKELNNLPVAQGAWLKRGENPLEPAVIAGTPAAKAGLKENDIILKVNNQTITSERTLSSIIQNFKVGDTINLEILRDGSERAVGVVLGEIE